MEHPLHLTIQTICFPPASWINYWWRVFLSFSLQAHAAWTGAQEAHYTLSWLIYHVLEFTQLTITWLIYVLGLYQLSVTLVALPAGTAYFSAGLPMILDHFTGKQFFILRFLACHTPLCQFTDPDKQLALTPDLLPVWSTSILLPFLFRTIPGGQKRTRTDLTELYSFTWTFGNLQTLVLFYIQLRFPG